MIRPRPKLILRKGDFRNLETIIYSRIQGPEFNGLDPSDVF